jgi:hypothetical protein
VLAISGSPSSPAARAEASSPSGCTSVCTPIGASSRGAGIAVPSSSVARLREERSRESTLGTIRQRLNASRFARMVSSEPAPP